MEIVLNKYCKYTLLNKHVNPITNTLYFTSGGGPKESTLICFNLSKRSSCFVFCASRNSGCSKIDKIEKQLTLYDIVTFCSSSAELYFTGTYSDNYKYARNQFILKILK